MKAGSILTLLLLGAYSGFGYEIARLEFGAVNVPFLQDGRYSASASKSQTPVTGSASAALVQAATVKGIVGVPLAYQIQTDFNPTWYSASGLPPGFVCEGSGLIHGTPSAVGTFSVHVEARDFFQTASATIIISVTHGSITPASVQGIIGVPFGYQISADNNATWYSAAGLPPGFICEGSGLIHGIPRAAGTYSVHVEARNLFETVSATIVITINHGAISASDAKGIVGVSFAYQISANNNPTWYSASGLPPGFVSEGSGLIQGIPRAAGTFAVRVEARNLFETVSATIHLTFSPGTITGGTPPPQPSSPFILYPFTGTNDGANPVAPLVQASDGNFYGTTRSGGRYTNGTVFKINGNGVLSSLHSFSGTNDGANPEGGLVQGRDGNFYGTTSAGGRYTNGTVFKITGSGVLTTLYSFSGAVDGANPVAGLVQGGDGSFYGTTPFAGRYANGTVFKISTTGVLTSLYSFSGAADGGSPAAGLVLGSDGGLYGTTSSGGSFTNGTVFRISTNGVLTGLHSFTGGDGANPQAALVRGRDGNFYGTTYGGGAYSSGTVFQITTNGVLTRLYSFTGTNDGANPKAALVRAGDGTFYGTTVFGGSSGDGTVFQINTNGGLADLHSFSGGDGANPEAGLVLASDGSFYGTTSNGGQQGGGTVFRFNFVPTQAVTISKSALHLTWSTEAGAQYQLQYKYDLSSSKWASQGDPVTAAGQTLTFTDSVTNGPRRFYRLLRSP
ncbi:MAG TPA: choice-of-anchor tandem repeat GloVer-containing protein [Verrucomicrobiae bacterium]|nr:choice-of-anchor tandem repeat GloVer-containing protein [Verrucomicrobiae bacterium]